MQRKLIAVLCFILISQGAFAGPKLPVQKYPLAHNLRTGITQALQRNGGLANLSAKINFAKMARLPKRSEGLPALQRVLHQEAGAYKGFNVGNAISALAVLGYESQDATRYLLSYFKDEAEDTFLEPAATLLLYRAAKRHNMQDVVKEMEEDGVLGISQEEVDWLAPWVKTRGPLARTVTDLSDEATYVWTGYAAPAQRLEDEPYSSTGMNFIRTRGQLQEYAARLNQNPTLTKIIEEGALTEMAAEYRRNLRKSNPVESGEKTITYLSWLEDITAVLRQIKVDMVCIAQEESYPLNAAQAREWIRQIVTFRNYLSGQSVYLYEVPASMASLKDLLTEISDQYLEALQHVATAQ